MKILKKVFKKIMVVLMVLVICFVGFISFIIIADYKPELVENGEILNNSSTEITGDTFSITTYNIGYGGLDKDQDFFMDGGTMSRSSSYEKTEENMNSFLQFIENQNSDFYLLQEIDVKALRSFDIDQREMISEYFPNHTSTFAYNFKAKWVPVPIFNPIGNVNAGLMNLSKYTTSSSTRYQLPGVGPFPQRYVDLDRCILEDVYTLEDGKSLYVLNIHLSAYDKGGTIRTQQVEFLIDYINEIYNDGENYIVFGGDWNHLLDNSRMTDDLPEWVAILPDELFDTNFQLVYDTTVSTVRSDDKAYVEGENFETVIDGFLVSPNITIQSVVGHDLGFENSDHNPVTVEIKLN